MKQIKQKDIDNLVDFVRFMKARYEKAEAEYNEVRIQLAKESCPYEEEDIIQFIRFSTGKTYTGLVMHCAPPRDRELSYPYELCVRVLKKDGMWGAVREYVTPNRIVEGNQHGNK